jgi:hypothetical protein
VKETQYSLVSEVTTAPQHAAMIRCRCLLFPAFFVLLPPAPAPAPPADEDSGILEEDEEAVGLGSIELASGSAGMLRLAMMPVSG